MFLIIFMSSDVKEPVTNKRYLLAHKKASAHPEDAFIFLSPSWRTAPSFFRHPPGSASNSWTNMLVQTWHNLVNPMPAQSLLLCHLCLLVHTYAAASPLLSCYTDTSYNRPCEWSLGRKNMNKLVAFFYFGFDFMSLAISCPAKLRLGERGLGLGTNQVHCMQGAW